MTFITLFIICLLVILSEISTNWQTLHIYWFIAIYVNKYVVFLNIIDNIPFQIYGISFRKINPDKFIVMPDIFNVLFCKMFIQLIVNRDEVEVK